MVVLRKNLVIEKKGQKVEEQVRYFFYITNERDWSAAALHRRYSRSGRSE